jgi:CDP-diacylglycerol--glycerol-3-phosphate 3-phosphatidyltransferase
MSIEQRDRSATAPDPRREGRRRPSSRRRCDRLIESRLTPNAISMVGLVGNLAAAVLIWQGYYTLGGIAFIIGSVMDTLDGRFARVSGKGTLFGAFLDSTLDRVEDGIVLTAVAYRFAETDHEFAAAMCVVVVLGSLMVSYTRARAEALGVECKVGLATRPVRVVILSVGSFREGSRSLRCGASGTGDLRDGGADRFDRGTARLARPQRAERAGRRIASSAR